MYDLLINETKGEFSIYF